MLFSQISASGEGLMMVQVFASVHQSLWGRLGVDMRGRVAAATGGSVTTSAIIINTKHSALGWVLIQFSCLPPTKF